MFEHFEIFTFLIYTELNLQYLLIYNDVLKFFGHQLEVGSFRKVRSVYKIFLWTITIPTYEKKCIAFTYCPYFSRVISTPT